MISASAFLDGIYNALTSASEFGSDVVTKNDYTILTRAPGACAFVVRFNGIRPEAYAYGKPRSKIVLVDMTVEGYIREENDLTQILEHQVQAADDLSRVLTQDETFGGTVMKSSVEVNVQIGLTIEMGGFRWVPISAQVVGMQSC